jgi:cell fate regulator YaaT (PSP1 superfamily)
LNAGSPRTVVGVRFRNAGRIFYFDSAGMRLEAGEYVVVETARGPEVGRVVIAPDQVVVNELGDEPLQPVLRLATEADIRRAEELHRQAQGALREAREMARDLGFPGHLDAAEYSLDGKRLTISYSAEERLDHRELGRALAERFGVRVELRPIGARDRAKIVGGYGICGRELCCASWLATFPSISIRMAKNQDLPLTPEKISGLCGRLLCCLSYEDEVYQEMRRTLPKVGQRVSTPTGEAKVVAVNVLRREITLSVHGQNVTVGDRDLGLIVRWDPTAKTAEPPPPLTPEEAVAQGLVRSPEEFPRWPPEPRTAAEAAAYGRLPRQVRAALIEEPPPFEPAVTLPPKPEAKAPKARKFVRGGEAAAAATPPAPTPAAAKQPPAGAPPPAEPKGKRRRRGRRKRR